MGRFLAGLGFAMAAAVVLALFRRRKPAPPPAADPAEELKRKLAETRADEPPAPAEPEPPGQEEPPLDERRRAVHDRARAAMDDMLGGEDPRAKRPNRIEPMAEESETRKFFDRLKDATANVAAEDEGGRRGPPAEARALAGLRRARPEDGGARRERRDLASRADRARRADRRAEGAAGRGRRGGRRDAGRARERPRPSRDETPRPSPRASGNCTGAPHGTA